MQVRIAHPALVQKLKRLAFDRNSSVPKEVTRLLVAVFAVERKVKQWHRDRVKK